MAAADSNPPPLPTGTLPGVTVDETTWGLIYEGEKSALIAAGVLREEWMPRVPAGKRKAVGTTTLTGGRKVNVSRKGVKATRLSVWHYFNSEELAQRQPRLDAERLAAHAHEKAEREIASWPATREDYARRLERFACTVLDPLRAFAAKGIGGGFRVAPGSMLEIDEALARLVEALRDAEVTFDPGERARNAARLRSTAASHDPAFGQFLGRVLEAPGEGEATA